LTGAWASAVQRWAQVNVGYPTSPITHPDRSRRHPRPGERVPDLPVFTAETSSLFRILRQGMHLLVIGGTRPDRALDSMAGMPHRDLVQVVTAPLDHTSGPRRAGTPMAYLVRPDGYLAARGTPEKLASICDYLRALASGASSG
jgi:hypothetical protein